MSAVLSIREATREDVPLILAFVRELAHSEKEPESVVATEADLARDGFGSAPKFHVLIAEWSGEPVAFAFYFFGYSTWQGRSALKLEDLFVRPSHRKHGIGRALMRRLAQIAIAAECTRFEWQVLDWNRPAKDFYDRLGANVMKGWESVRIDGQALIDLAGESV